MNRKLIRSLVEFVKAEEQNRATARESMSAEAAYDHAIFYDDPLTNELYLLLLLFMWHDIEKETFSLPPDPGYMTLALLVVMTLGAKSNGWLDYRLRSEELKLKRGYLH